MALANLSEYYVELFRSLAAGQLIYDYDKDDFRRMTEDDDDYELIGEFLERSRFVSAMDFEAEYLVMDRKNSIKKFIIYLNDPIDNEGECICEVWDSGASFRTEADTDYCYMEGYGAADLFIALEELVRDAGWGA